MYKAKSLVKARCSWGVCVCVPRWRGGWGRGRPDCTKCSKTLGDTPEQYGKFPILPIFILITLGMFFYYFDLVSSHTSLYLLFFFLLCGCNSSSCVQSSVCMILSCRECWLMLYIISLVAWCIGLVCMFTSVH